MSNFAEFQPSQILCLAWKDSYLYAEVIQTATERHLCWVRPLALVMGLEDFRPDVQQFEASEQTVIYDLRQGADLLWPTRLFRVALDTEVIPLLMQLGDEKQNPERDRLAHQQLRDFVYCVWQAHPEVFQG